MAIVCLRCVDDKKLYLDSRYDSCVKGEGQNNEILVVWLVKQISLTCIDI